jgi:hypothetical protein
MTRVERFEGGVLSSIEQDSDQDGRIDTWETYVDGALSVLALDTTGRGSPDRRLLYSSSGEVRVEVDPDGAGEFRALDSEP